MKNSKEWMAKFLTSFNNALFLPQNGSTCNSKVLFRNVCEEKCSWEKIFKISLFAGIREKVLRIGNGYQFAVTQSLLSTVEHKIGIK